MSSPPSLRAPAADRAERERGFTLIELLLVVVLLGIITVPLTGAIVGYLKNSDATSDRMLLSHDAQISAAYLASDIAGVGVRDYTTTPPAGATVSFQASIQLDAGYSAGGRVCGSAATRTAKLRLLADDWDDSTVPPTVRVDVVAYYLTEPVDGVSALHRIRCAGSTTPAVDLVLAHDVDPATWVVTCATPITCDGTSVPRQVSVAFLVTPPRTGGLPGFCAAVPAPSTCYPITLTGQRRQS